ncbi:MAG: MBL fold metallo-hydrolase [Clostridia bacterium]|nr:MBL fold metallo-hydrolase [Clostridia bacterium]
MIKLKYGNTNKFYFPGGNGGLLLDTDYAGTLHAYYKALKANGIEAKSIKYVLATHYHPDHMGLISELMKQGVTLLLVDIQSSMVHFADSIINRDQLPYSPIDEAAATVISCEDSRKILSRLGISGEIIYTPSHSVDSISLILDDGNCFVEDLEPLEYLEAYEDNVPLKRDWEHILSFKPKKIFYAHVSEKIME